MRKQIYICDVTGKEIPEGQTLSLCIDRSFDGAETSDDNESFDLSFEALRDAVMYYFEDQGFEANRNFVETIKRLKIEYKHKAL